MNALGPGWIVCTVLFVAGVWKLLQPLPLWRSGDTYLAARPWARRVRPLWRPAAVRVLALVEVAVAPAAVIGGEWWFAAVAALYVLFAASATALARARLQCGCFGAASAVATRRHPFIALVAAGGALCAALGGAPGAAAAWGELPALGVPHVLLVGAGAAATVALLTFRGSPAPAVTTPVTFRLTGDRPA